MPQYYNTFHFLCVLLFQYRTWARPNLVANVHLAQDWGVRMYNWLEQNFQPPFPIDKFGTSCFRHVGRLASDWMLIH